MKTNKKETRYVSLLTVYVPSAEALIDMMRYDRCCPHTEEEAHKVMRLITAWHGTDADRKKADHVITLLRFAAANNPATEGRWQSFGCAVLDERSPDAGPATKEEIENAITVAKAQRKIRY